MSKFHGSGKARNQNPASARRIRSERIGIAAVVTNVIAPVDWRDDPAEAFFLHRTQKVTRISSPAQTAFCNWGCVKSAFKREAGFLRRVIKGTDYEIFAVMSLRTPRQSFVLIRKPLDNFRPRDICSESGRSENVESRDSCDQVPKSDSIGPPIKTSIGSRFHSYS